MRTSLEMEKAVSPTVVEAIASNAPSLAPRMDREIDMGAQFMLAHPEYSDYTEKEARKVLWKIDLHILPIITICSTLAAADKIVISNAKLYGMTTDLHLIGQQYSWIGSIFYFGYLSMELPANLMLQKFPVGKCLAISYLFWNCILLLMASAQNFAGLATLRFLLGMGETFLFPAETVITSMFYKKEEQGLRAAIWFSGFSSLITGALSYGIGHASSKIASWRLLFITFACITIFFACLLAYLVPDSPMHCRWLNERESYIAIDRTKENRTGIKNTNFKKDQIIEALTDYKSWLMCIFVICFNIPNGALVTFAAQIVSGMGYGVLHTTLLGMPTGVFMTFSSFFIYLLTHWTPKRFQSIAIAFVGLVPLVCCVLIKELNRETTNKNSLLVVYYFFYFYWGPYVGMLSLSMANTAGHTKKTIVNAMNFISYCVSNIIAPQFFIAKEAPDYKTGFNAILAFISVGIAVILIYGAGCIYENKKRDARYGEPSTDYNPEEDSLDLTDKQKADVFRYSW